MQGLLEGKGDINQYISKTLGDIYNLNEHVNEESETISENHVESDQNSKQRPEEMYGDTAGFEKKLDELEQLLDRFQFSTNKNEPMNLNRNLKEEITRINPFNISMKELETIIERIPLDNATEVSDKEKNNEKATKVPFERYEYKANNVNDNKGINVDNEHERQTNFSELTLSNKIETDIKEDGEQNDIEKLGAKHVDKSNIKVDNRITEPQEQLTTLKGLDEELFVKTTTIQKNVELENVSNTLVIMTSPSSKEAEPIVYTSMTKARNVNFNIDEEKIKTDSETESTTRSLDVVNDKTVHTSDEFSGITSTGSGVSNTKVENRKLFPTTTKENSIAGKELNKNVNTKKDRKAYSNKFNTMTKTSPFSDDPTVFNEVSTSHNSFITNKEISEKSIYSKSNEETFIEGSVTQIVGNNNDHLNHPDHPSNIDEVTEDIKHDFHATGKEEKDGYLLNHNIVTLTSDVIDNANRDNKVHHTTTTSDNSVANSHTKTGSVVEKNAVIAIKQDTVNDIPLSFHHVEEKVKRQTTKQNSKPTKTPIERSKLEEKPNNESDLSNEHLLETEENVVEDIGKNDDKPCNCIR